jgi:hypothetical protein
MTPDTDDSRPIKTGRIEILFALLLIGLGALAISDSLRLGIRWAADGPRAGFFPFVVGSLLVASSLVILVQALRGRSHGVFARVHELKLVATIAGPAAVYVATIPFLGIYVPSVALIFGFMRWLGGYAWWLAAATALGIVLTFFVVFETWFLVSLPKGPLETALGY